MNSLTVPSYGFRPAHTHTPSSGSSVPSERTLTSTLTGKRRPLTDARLAWFTFKYPFITLKVIGLIHWHAWRLWLKNVPWFAKAARAMDQRDLYRPHASLVAAPGVRVARPEPVSPPS